MKTALILTLLTLQVFAADPTPQRYTISARASELDPRAKPHPEIKFIFADDKGKPKDLQQAMVDTRVAPRGQLVIWLMGYNAGLFERISSYGLHGIQVHYANGWFGGLSKSEHDECTNIGRIRLEAATGEDHSPLVAIPQPDGMMERALQFVKWLAKENPEGHWEQFIRADGKELVWDKVIIAGISHGSTTAARFAKHKKVARVVMFSGPRDQLETWQAFPSATPANRYFGFTHILDSGWTGDHYCRSWQMLGLHAYGPLVDVDQSAPPYANSRRLITNADVKNDGKRAHSAVVPGGSSVKDTEGRYVYEDVWRYLFTHPVEQTGKAVPLSPDCRMDLRSK